MEQPHRLVSLRPTSGASESGASSSQKMAPAASMRIHSMVASTAASRTPSADAAAIRSPSIADPSVALPEQLLRAAGPASPASPGARLSLPSPTGLRRPKSSRHKPGTLQFTDAATTPMQPACPPTEQLENHIKMLNIGDFADVNTDSGKIVRVYPNELQSLTLIGVLPTCSSVQIDVYLTICST